MRMHDPSHPHVHCLDPWNPVQCMSSIGGMRSEAVVDGAHISSLVSHQATRACHFGSMRDSSPAVHFFFHRSPSKSSHTCPLNCSCRYRLGIFSSAMMHNVKIALGHVLQAANRGRKEVDVGVWHGDKPRGKKSREGGWLFLTIRQMDLLV